MGGAHGAWGCAIDDGDDEERGTCDTDRCWRCHAVKLQFVALSPNILMRDTFCVCVCRSLGIVSHFSFWGVCRSTYILVPMLGLPSQLWFEKYLRGSPRAFVHWKFRRRRSCTAAVSAIITCTLIKVHVSRVCTRSENENLAYTT
jgi:hypothetical protein